MVRILDPAQCNDSTSQWAILWHSYYHNQPHPLPPLAAPFPPITSPETNPPPEFCSSLLNATSIPQEEEKSRFLADISPHAKICNFLFPYSLSVLPPLPIFPEACAFWPSLYPHTRSFPLPLIPFSSPVWEVFEKFPIKLHEKEDVMGEIGLPREKNVVVGSRVGAAGGSDG